MHTKQYWGRLFATVLLLLPLFVHAAQPLGCLIEPDRIAEIGSPVVGVVDSVLVERGDVVRKGQPLATLRADVERASVDVANSRSNAVAEVRAAEANLKLAQATEKRQEYLLQKKFVSQQAVEKASAETAIAREKLALAREQLKINDGELKLARAQLGQRSIRAPFDGIIADRYVWPGERVEEKPLFRVVKIHPLRVEIVMPAALFGTVAVNSSIKIQPQLPNSTAVNAKVTLVDKLIDGASNTFRVRAEIANEDMAIPSGLRCKAELTTEKPATAADNNVANTTQTTTTQSFRIESKLSKPATQPATAPK